jgi:hypothetical protein
MIESDMANTPEGKVQLEIMQYLTKKGHLFWRNSPNSYDPKLGIYKSNPYMLKGLPDILLIDREQYGQLVGIEIKRPKGGKVSAAQLLMKRRFELSNARYEIVKSLDEVKKLGL